MEIWIRLTTCYKKIMLCAIQTIIFVNAMLILDIKLKSVFRDSDVLLRLLLIQLLNTYKSVKFVL